MTPNFVHLRLHTEYSLVDGTIRIKPLVERVKALGMPAVAVTDDSNLFALVKFYRAAEKAGIKPIAGSDLWLFNTAAPDDAFRVTLLCQNRTGYHNLCRLISRAYLDGQHRGRPRIQQQWLREASEGLIAISPGPEGDIGRALANNHANQAQQLLERWQRQFPDRFYLELRRTGREAEQLIEPQLLSLAADASCPVVASNDVRFLEPEDFNAHEARVCIHEGRLLADPRRERRYSEQQYLKSPAAMAEAFADVPSALDNTTELAKRCNLDFEFDRYYLPAFPETRGQSEPDFLRTVAARGLEQRLEKHGLAEGWEAADYQQRLTHELDVIIDMGFPGYFLIVADFIRWAKREGVPVGPGRGSGAGSLVAYALEITDLDPLRYELLFERFLNPERVSMPDFDVDFCMERRDEVIRYVAETYGRDHVSQIITYGSMAAKAVVRDCGRVLGHGYGFVDSIAKLIPLTLGITLKKALAEEPELKTRYQEEEDTRGVLDLAMSLEGLARNAGKHAGGVVIAPKPLTEFTALYAEAGGEGVVTQFDKDDVETIGLVKFDFLGLRTLTIIDWALVAINRRREKAGEAPLDLSTIPLDDQSSFDLLQACRTTAVFQLESRGMKDLVRRLQPDSFEDIVALVALFRPGPLQSGMVDDFIDRKHGRATVTYPHPKLEPILQGTYGVILYQEQVMQIAQDLAGYSLGAADLLRRAMGKKKPEEMAKQRSIFVAGATERGVAAALAESIFNLMETFAGYGFNKSHSAAYALIAYQTAYLKAHYPAEFMAAVLSADMDNTDKIANAVDECRSMALEIEAPDVNVSDYVFTARHGDRVRYGLGAIKGVGHSAIEAIRHARHREGAFSDLEDFCRRIDLLKVNRRSLETLIRAGALDPLDTDANRARLLARLPGALQAAEQSQRDAAAGQNDMFGAASPTPAPEQEDTEAWTDRQRLGAEKETLGLYLTGHPVDAHLQELARFTTGRLEAAQQRVASRQQANGADHSPNNGGGQGGHHRGQRGGRQRGRGGEEMTLAGLVTAIRRRPGRGAFVTIDDQSGKMEVAFFEETWTQFAESVVKDEIIVVSGQVAVDDFNGGIRMSARSAMSLAEAKRHYARAVQLRIRDGMTLASQRLTDTFAPYRKGQSPVFVEYCNSQARARLELGEQWRVQACEELIAALNAVEGVVEARLIYGR